MSDTCSKEGGSIANELFAELERSARIIANQGL
jgi:hypothetical protein